MTSFLRPSSKSTVLVFLLVAGLGLIVGAVLVSFGLRTEIASLVHPKSAANQTIQELRARLNPPATESAADTLREFSPWGLLPDGRETPKPGGQAPVAPQDRWVLVGRVRSTDGLSIVLHQPESGQSKRIKDREALPDGRILLSIEDAALVVRSKQSRKPERIDIGTGLVIQTSPSGTVTVPTAN